jgi:hypothetical protein
MELLIKKKFQRKDVKELLIDAFKKEVYQLAQLRTHTDDFWAIEETEDNRRILTNIMKDIRKKWNKLCHRCSLYKETAGLITDEDLTFEEPEPKEA